MPFFAMDADRSAAGSTVTAAKAARSTSPTTTESEESAAEAARDSAAASSTVMQEPVAKPRRETTATTTESEESETTPEMPAPAASASAPALNAHLGPLPLPEGHGTLTAEDRKRIMEQTKCSVSVRFRSQWDERCLVVTGPPDKLEEGYKAALAAIKKMEFMGAEGIATTAKVAARAMMVEATAKAVARVNEARANANMAKHTDAATQSTRIQMRPGKVVELKKEVKPKAVAGALQMRQVVAGALQLGLGMAAGHQHR